MKLTFSFSKNESSIRPTNKYLLMKFLPVSINIADKKILLIGGGRVALEKLNSLRRFTCRITIVSRVVDKKILDYPCRIILKSYEKSDLEGFYLVYACTDNPQVNRKIKNDCEDKGTLVNVVDNPASCRFISPAIYKKENMTVAVSSNGEDVKRSIRWRNRIGDFIENTGAGAGILPDHTYFNVTKVEQGQDIIIPEKREPGQDSIPGRSENTGKVTIIGFGPGDPEYLTIKGKRALENADIIFYDDLIDKNYISRFPGEKIFVGKRKGNHSKEQEEINTLLFQAALTGKNAARLKGGDPSIFGRLGEEVQYLQERSVEVDIIPGVTAASAASAKIGIPLTRRGVSKTVAFCSGHRVNDIKIPDAEVLVFFMAASNLGRISHRLITRGWQADTPVAVVSNISMPGQTVRIEKLGDITTGYKADSPSIIIVGKVVDRDMVYRYLKKPKILVTCPDRGNYEKYGSVVHSPLVQEKPGKVPGDPEKIITGYDYLIFNSGAGVIHFFTNLLAAGKDSRSLKKQKIVSTAREISSLLGKWGIIPDIEIPGDQEKVVNYFSSRKINHVRILVPGNADEQELLLEGLRKLRNQADALSVYSYVLPDNIYKADLYSFRYITFSSVPAVENFNKLYGKLPAHIQPVISCGIVKKRMTELQMVE